jgi:nitrogen fixation NifU-like protein
MGYYSDVLMEHFQSPRNSGKMESPDRIGLVGVPGQGPFLLLCLRLNGAYVTDAKFQTHGCGATIASGSILTEMIIHRSIVDCMSITEGQVIEALGGIPADKAHCPAMAVAALRHALRDDNDRESGPGREDQQ